MFYQDDDNKLKTDNGTADVIITNADNFSSDIAAGTGYTGIIVALIGGLTPLGTVIAAVLFGAMVNGGFMMQVITGVPKSMVFAMQAITLLFFLCSTLMSQYRIQKVTEDV